MNSRCGEEIRMQISKHRTPESAVNPPSHHRVAGLCRDQHSGPSDRPKMKPVKKQYRMKTEFESTSTRKLRTHSKSSKRKLPKIVGKKRGAIGASMPCGGALGGGPKLGSKSHSCRPIPPQTATTTAGSDPKYKPSARSLRCLVYSDVRAVVFSSVASFGQNTRDVS